MSAFVSSRLFNKIKSLSLVSGVALLVASCSSDVMRFAENPFSNPFASSERAAVQEQAPARRGFAADPVTTSSVSPQPVARVERVDVAPITTASVTPAPLAAQNTIQQTSQTAGAVASQRSSSASQVSQWSAANGTIISAGPNDTVQSLSFRYGVPASALMAANGLNQNSQIQQGQRIVIPAYTYGGQRTPDAAPAQQKKPEPVKPTAASEVPAKTAMASTSKPVSAPAPKPEPVKSQVSNKTNTAEAQKTNLKEPVKEATKPQVAQAENKQTKVVKQAEKVEKAEKETQPIAEKPQAPVKVASLPTANDASPEKTAPEFRWPVKGRVISGFGPKGQGQSNDGINISVPEGTPVKAAEGGQVIYSGNELKGYGNLVLVRHDNGWVSAYGHNSQILVKKGDRVTRGQNIAKSGDTGDVSSPQVHFELRKGSTPVDPLKYMP